MPNIKSCRRFKFGWDLEKHTKVYVEGNSQGLFGAFKSPMCIIARLDFAFANWAPLCKKTHKVGKKLYIECNYTSDYLQFTQCFWLSNLYLSTLQKCDFSRWIVPRL